MNGRPLRHKSWEDLTGTRTMNRNRITKPIHSNFESVRAQIRALPRLHTYYRVGYVACEQLAATAWLRLERDAR